MAYMLDDVPSSSSCINKKDDDSNRDQYSTSNNNNSDDNALLNKKGGNTRITRQRVLIAYLVTYNILGIILHPNFYPWT